MLKHYECVLLKSVDLKSKARAFSLADLTGLLFCEELGSSSFFILLFLEGGTEECLVSSATSFTWLMLELEAMLEATLT